MADKKGGFYKVRGENDVDVTNVSAPRLAEIAQEEGLEFVDLKQKPDGTRTAHIEKVVVVRPENGGEKKA